MEEFGLTEDDNTSNYKYDDKREKHVKSCASINLPQWNEQHQFLHTPTSQSPVR
jgi:hypothetical protein